MNDETPYPIGKPNQKWGATERSTWLNQQTIKRAYQIDVLDKLEALKLQFHLEQYSALTYNPERYPLFAVKSKDWSAGKPTALITGGVHGYETSGVLGALGFLEKLLQPEAQAYSQHFNIVVVPCVSPWSYETINRWNPHAVDPNRSFITDSPADESAALMDYVRALNCDIAVHIDLHETTDTDNTEFRPALAARDNVHQTIWQIPDGFYLVGDSENPCHEFQSHIIEGVSKITHIAASDTDDRLIGELTTQYGVINCSTQALGLCTGFSNATFSTTTEVYPDSPRVDNENCILAQVTAIFSALDYVRKQ